MIVWKNRSNILLRGILYTGFAHFASHGQKLQRKIRPPSLLFSRKSENRFSQRIQDAVSARASRFFREFDGAAVESSVNVMHGQEIMTAQKKR